MTRFLAGPLLLLGALVAAAPARAQDAAPPRADSATAAATPVVLPADFVRRRQAGRGAFLTREQIARRHPSATLNVFTAASGVRLVPDGSGGMRVQMTRRPAPQNRDLPSTFSENRGVSPTMGGGSEEEKMIPAGTARTNEGAAGASSPGDDCRVQYYRNGLRYFPDRESRISREIPVASVVAVEVYRTRAETPAELAGAGTDCGVIVIWTDAPAAP
jgi:hypothetical protein